MPVRGLGATREARAELRRDPVPAQCQLETLRHRPLARGQYRGTVGEGVAHRCRSWAAACLGWRFHRISVTSSAPRSQRDGLRRRLAACDACARVCGEAGGPTRRARRPRRATGAACADARRRAPRRGRAMPRAGGRTARENVEDLVDPGSFVEYGGFAIAAQRQRRDVEELIARTPADGRSCADAYADRLDARGGDPVVRNAPRAPLRRHLVSRRAGPAAWSAGPRPLSGSSSR